MRTLMTLAALLIALPLMSLETSAQAVPEAPDNCGLPSSIELSPGTYDLDAGCSASISGIYRVFSGTVTINGNGATLDGNGSFRHFLVLSGARLILRDMTLRNGFAEGNGGAILNEGGRVVVENVRFINNTAFEGGAIYNTASSGETEPPVEVFPPPQEEGLFRPFGFTDSPRADHHTVMMAQALGGDPVQRADASIDCCDLDGGFEVQDSTFIGNKAEGGDGGAINNQAAMRVRNSTFVDNTAGDGQGSAFYNSGSAQADLRDNYWGSESGPGNSVTGGGVVLLDSWLAIPPDDLFGRSFLPNRVNDDPARDLAPPAAIFQDGPGAPITVYGIYGDDGSPVMGLGQQDLARACADVPADEPRRLLETEDGRFILSILPSGEIQLNTWEYDPYGENDSKPYVVTWDGCPVD